MQINKPGFISTTAENLGNFAAKVAGEAFAYRFEHTITLLGIDDAMNRAPDDSLARSGEFFSHAAHAAAFAVLPDIILVAAGRAVYRNLATDEPLTAGEALDWAGTSIGAEIMDFVNGAIVTAVFASASVYNLGRAVLGK